MGDGLAVGHVAVNHQQAADGFTLFHPVGMISRITEQRHGFVGIDHGRENTAETVDTVQAFDEPGLCLARGMAANGVGN